MGIKILMKDSILLDFLSGSKNALPIVAGYLPLGFACGVISDDAGLTVFQTAIMSLLVFAGAGQYIAAGMIGVLMPPLSIIMTVLIVNLRHLLYTSALYPHISSWNFLQKAIFSFQITDETFALQSSLFRKKKVSYSMAIGVNITSHLGWIIGNVLGAIFGSYIDNSSKFGLDFALPSLFIALLVPQIVNKTGLIVAIVSGILSLIFALTGNKSLIILAAVIAATVGLIFEKKKYA